MSMATTTETQPPALHVADVHDLIRVHGARESSAPPRNNWALAVDWQQEQAVPMTIASPETTSAFFAACDLALDVVRSRRVASGWERESAVEGFTVGALAAHVYSAIRRFEAALEEPEPVSPEVVGDIASFYGLNRIEHRGQLRDSFHIAIREDAAKRANQGPDALAQRFEAMVGRLRTRLAAEPMNRLVPVWRIEGGATELANYLQTRVVELVVHTDDLAASVGMELDLPPEAACAAFAVFVELARARSGDVAVLRAFARRERAASDVLRVL
jgi:uncharacterized protein (TIGR03083 family)